MKDHLLKIVYNVVLFLIVAAILLFIYNSQVVDEVSRDPDTGKPRMERINYIVCMGFLVFIIIVYKMAKDFPFAMPTESLPHLPHLPHLPANPFASRRTSS